MIKIFSKLSGESAKQFLFGIFGLAMITVAAVALHLQPGATSLLYLIVVVFVSLRAGFVSSVAVSLDAPLPRWPRNWLDISPLLPAKRVGARALATILSGRRRRTGGPALASVRCSNCTCEFPACSFHEDSVFRGPMEGINRTSCTSPYSPYSWATGNCNQAPGQCHRRNRCALIRRRIQPSSWWKS
jgi:hypothetical protein